MLHVRLHMMVLCSFTLLTALHGYLPHLSRPSELQAIMNKGGSALPDHSFILNLNDQNIRIRKEILKIIEIKSLKIQADDQIGCNDSI